METEGKEFKKAPELTPEEQKELDELAKDPLLCECVALTSHLRDAFKTQKEINASETRIKEIEEQNPGIKKRAERFRELAKRSRIAHPPFEGA